MGEIQKLLKIKQPSGNIAAKIHEELLSYSGLALIISSLSVEERNILNAAYKEKNGITFAELEKKLKLNTEKIERCTNNLTRKLLAYVLKNRQKLSNKLDKIYLIPELRNTLNPLENNFISAYFKDTVKILESGSISKCKNMMHSVKKSFIGPIEFIFNSGGVTTLEEFNNYIQQKSSQKILLELSLKKYLNIFHDLIQTGRTLIILNKKVFIGLAIYKDYISNLVNVHNKFNLLLNMLKSYDVVSTYGLFLTKQKEFRKIDRKHLNDAMIKLINIDGAEFTPNTLSQLSLYLLFLQNTAIMKYDSIIISLKNIAHLLDDPGEWLVNIIKLLQGVSNDDMAVHPPFEMPIYQDLILIIDLIYRNNSTTYKLIEFLFFVKYISKIPGDLFSNVRQTKQNAEYIFKNSIRFLCLSGIIEMENSLIKLSDIGSTVSEKLKITDTQNPDFYHDINEIPVKSQRDIKQIYLNSDFILMIPKEISSEALYHLSTHTETVIDDVILQTRISRESILTSLKRGMTTEKFFSTLKKYLKTDIPGNLNFLISEWSSQTIRLNINTVTILNTNQPSFIDRLLHSKIKNSVIKRISLNYAVIDRRFLDKIIKMGKENDAVINLFDESEELD